MNGVSRAPRQFTLKSFNLLSIIDALLISFRFHLSNKATAYFFSVFSVLIKLPVSTQEVRML